MISDKTMAKIRTEVITKHEASVAEGLLHPGDEDGSLTELEKCFNRIALECGGILFIRSHDFADGPGFKARFFDESCAEKFRSILMSECDVTSQLKPTGEDWLRRFNVFFDCPVDSPVID